MKKYCARCEKDKDEEDFYKNRKSGCALNYCKQCARRQVVERQQRLKRACVEYKGGKCVKCNYNRYLGALDFHHRDPNEKDFNVSHLKNTNMSSKIKKELDKCDLLCSTCHKEEHALWRYGELYELSGEYLVLKKDKIVHKCKDCSVVLNFNNKRCLICEGKSKRKVVWPSREELEGMLDNMSYCSIGRKYGVSDNAVRKWKKSYGI
jgi:hypothetical protein